MRTDIIPNYYLQRSKSHELLASPLQCLKLLTELRYAISLPRTRNSREEEISIKFNSKAVAGIDREILYMLHDMPCGRLVPSSMTTLRPMMYTTTHLSEICHFEVMSVNEYNAI